MTVSIIIPVYNVAPYLRECLDSVLNQTFADWEAVCVDDGSTDGSAEMLDEYAAKDKRFVVVHQSNAGVSAARNSALEIANGGWVMFVDADDLLAPSALSVIGKVIKGGTDFDFIAFGSVRFEGDTHIIHRDGCGTIVNRYDYDEFVSRRFHHRDLWEGCYKRSAFGDLRFKAGLTMGEDRLYQAEVFARVKSIAHIHNQLYCYRIRVGSAVNSARSVKKLIDRVTYRILADEILDKAGRRPVCDERAHALFMTETFSRDYFLLDEEGRNRVRPFWNKALRHYLKSRYSPAWTKVAAAVALAIPFDWIRSVLFRLPYYLKRKGIHR